MSPLEKRPDYLVCTCMCVMYSDIIAALNNGYDSYIQLQDLLGVGTGCSSCVQEVQEIIREYHAAKKC